MDILVQTISAFFATLFFSIIFNISKSELIYCGIVGCAGWFVYSILLKIDVSMMVSNFIAAMVISLIAFFLAKKRKNPVTIYLASGIIPLVPGAGMYKTMFKMISGEYAQASKYLIETLEVAGVIAIAIAINLSFLYIKKR